MSEELFQQIKKHEGFSPKATNIKTQSGGIENNKTIGFGYNLDASNNPQRDLIRSGVKEEDLQEVLEGKKPISEDVANRLFEISVTKASKDASEVITNFHKLDEPVRNVMINMSYQMGRDGLRKFKNMRASLLKEDYPQVAREILNSKFAREQSTNRAKELAKQVMDYAASIEPEKKILNKTALDQYKEQLKKRLIKVYKKSTEKQRIQKALTTMIKNQSKENKQEVTE